MNAIVKRWQGISLILRILVGLILGAVLGVVAPNLTILTILGDIFVGALKAVAPVLVFVLVIASLANASVGIGNRFRTVVVLYMLTTFLAAGVAVIGSFLFPIRAAESCYIDSSIFRRACSRACSISWGRTAPSNRTGSSSS